MCVHRLFNFADCMHQELTQCLFVEFDHELLRGVSTRVGIVVRNSGVAF